MAVKATSRKSNVNQVMNISASVDEIFDSDAVVLRQTGSRDKRSFVELCVGTEAKQPVRAINGIVGGRLGLMTTDKKLVRVGDTSYNALIKCGFKIN